MYSLFNEDIKLNRISVSNGTIFHAINDIFKLLNGNKKLIIKDFCYTYFYI